MTGPFPSRWLGKFDLGLADPPWNWRARSGKGEGRSAKNHYPIMKTLNMEQIEELKPPPNPAKTTDSRFAAYQANFGVESWELDALPPDYIERLIEDQIKGMIDDAQWQRDRQRREEERRPIGEIARRWNEVVGYVSGDQPDPYDVVF